MNDSGLTSGMVKANEDFKLLEFRMGVVNMIQKPCKRTCGELTPEEVREAQESLSQRVWLYKPKIVAFNGKSIYETFIGISLEREFNFGKQPNKFPNSETFMYVLPSSSARCSQLPAVADKVPFYLALKKFREYLNGTIGEMSDTEIMFP